MTPETFKKIRRALGLSVNDMAEAIRTEPRNVRKYESGTRGVTGMMTVLLAYMLRFGVLPPKDVEDIENFDG